MSSSDVPRPSSSSQKQHYLSPLVVGLSMGDSRQETRIPPLPGAESESARRVALDDAIAGILLKAPAAHSAWIELLAKASSETPDLLREEEWTLLCALSGRLSGFDRERRFATAWRSGAPEAEQRSATPSSSGSQTLEFHLACDELQYLPSGQRRCGIPLELQLVAWVAVISRALPLGGGGRDQLSVPRSLLLALLWPEAGGALPEGGPRASRRAHELRLTKLLQRAERVHGFRLRSGHGRIVCPAEPAPAIRVLGDPSESVPSYFARQSPEQGSAREFARYYGLGASRGRALFRHWQSALSSAGKLSSR